MDIYAFARTLNTWNCTDYVRYLTLRQCNKITKEFRTILDKIISLSLWSCTFLISDMKIIIASWTMAFKISYFTTCPSFLIDTIKGLKMFRIGKIYNSLLSYIWWINNSSHFSNYIHEDVNLHKYPQFTNSFCPNETWKWHVRKIGWVNGGNINKWCELLTHLLPNVNFAFLSSDTIMIYKDII